MTYIVQLIIYFICFFICPYALRAVDFNRLIRKNRVYEAQVLYIIIGMIMAYILCKFILCLTYRTFML